MELKSTYWRLTADDGGWYIDTAEQMAEFIRLVMTEDGGTKYALEPVVMTDAEFNALPEFNGF